MFKFIVPRGKEQGIKKLFPKNDILEKLSSKENYSSLTILSGRMLIKLKKGTLKMTTGQLRLWNELVTLLLVAIVFIVVMQSTLNWIWGLIGLAGLALILVIGIRIYKRFKGTG